MIKLEPRGPRASSLVGSVLGGVLALSGCRGCTKVELVDVNASFSVAELAWFEAEETLFVFYTAAAEQGIGPESQVELTYTTDAAVVPWTDVTELTNVHTHLPVDCGKGTRCGSLSLHVPTVPRDVGLRLRYARGGEMTLDSGAQLNVVGRGPAFSNRSLLIYGVFNERNQRVQWRSRHVFPTVRNEQATNLGLRRRFVVDGERSGTVAPGGGATAENPYGYAFAPACPRDFVSFGVPRVETEDRAAFALTDLPVTAAAQAEVCGVSTVFDAVGSFTATALARKNPEVRPAFPALRSPIREDTPLRFVLQPCQRSISTVHLTMQQQRLQVGPGDDTVCLDGWEATSFEDELVGRLVQRLDVVRTQGNDMVFSLALHHDDESGRLADKVEAALERVLSPEAAKSAPRAVGAFVLDSFGHSLRRPALKRQVLWCPATRAPGSTSGSTCALQLAFPDLALGPLTVGLPLPILPTRTQYENFISAYSTAQAGEMKKLSFRAPERTPASTNVEVGDFGVATFFNGELMTPAPGDALSYCEVEGAPPVVFRVPPLETPFPLSVLPELHASAPQPSYGLGLAWAFPFLLQLDYTSVLAGKLTAFTVAVPFGIASDATAFEGGAQWAAGTFDLSKTLLQCTRFCDQPTFDSSGVYQVLAPFRTTFQTRCYVPVFPTLDAGGFPSDP